MKQKQKTQQQAQKAKKETNQQLNLLKNKLQQYFPKKPYQTQLHIAKQLYSILQKGQAKVALVQSLTGTGKTYALLVGTLAWLKENPNQLKNINNQKDEENDQSNSMPSWLANKASENKLLRIENQKNQKISKLTTIAQFKQQKHKMKSMAAGKNKAPGLQTDNITGNKIQWQIQDIEDIGSVQDQKQAKSKKRLNNNQAIQMLSEKCLPKVIFVSRTHTQLGQVMQSIGQMDLQLRYVSMASKDHLCVHPNVQKNRVHEKCQYLLAHGGCPYYHQQGLSDFFGLKIQQAQKLGQSSSLCSYFAVKNLLSISDIICVPYSSILSPQVRTRLNINLQNSIIIFDEAHNIIQQQLGLKSPEISFMELKALCARIGQYETKYGNKMAQDNQNLLKHMQQICRGFMNIISKQYQKICQKIKQSQNHEQQGQPIPQQINYLKLSKVQLFAKLKLPQIKVNRIKTYISLSNFDQKLVHFNTKQPFSLATINKFVEFITVLTSNQCPQYINSTYQKQNTPQNTVVLIKSLPNALNQSLNNSSIKIFCMESTQLAEISHRARLVILAGGTMEPITSFTTIFKNAKLNYQFLKGSHVIKQEQCNVFCIGGIKQKNRQKYQIVFTHNRMKTNSKTIIQNACKIVQNIINRTQPNSGTVIFIQNYNLLQQISQVLGNKIKEIPIFYDSNSANSSTNKGQQKTNMSIFQKFQSKIKSHKSSAVLVSVMGGRLSQGINFSDELARSIIVLGLPYPNLKSPQMIEKMKYLDSKLKTRLNLQKQKDSNILFQTANKKLKGKQENSSIEQSGQNYFQNCCIRTLSQTIGRGIRHINDYANIYLIDARFEGISHRLPAWMQKRMEYIDCYQC